MDKDIQEMFRNKNREILIKNLKYDLDKNINSLIETITNIYNLEFDTAISKINEIFKDSIINNSGKFITDNVTNIKNNTYQIIEDMLLKKKQLLDSKIDSLSFEENEMNDYYSLVFDTTKQFKNKIEKEFTNVFGIIYEDFENYILNLDTDKKELTLSRISDYLSNRLYEKIVTKLFMELMLRDNNLINKAKESYLRFQEITLKTLKK